MKARLIIGSLLISTLLLSLWVDSQLDFAWASFCLLVLAGTGCAGEWNRISAKGGVATYPWLLIAAAVAYPVLACLRIRMNWAAGETDFLFFFVFMLLLLGRAVLSGHVTDGLDRLARTVLGFLLLYLFYHLVPIMLDRSAGGGLQAVYAVVLTSKSCDIGAYLIGRTFGKKKLIPRVSPGKTVAGSMGGVAFSAGLGAFLLPLMGLGSVWFGLLFGVILAAVTQLSDLAESLLKRCAGVKDSSQMLPEMGGFFDLVDSLILAAPAGYILLMVL